MHRRIKPVFKPRVNADAKTPSSTDAQPSTVKADKPPPTISSNKDDQPLPVRSTLDTTSTAPATTAESTAKDIQIVTPKDATSSNSITSSLSPNKHVHFQLPQNKSVVTHEITCRAESNNLPEKSTLPSTPTASTAEIEQVPISIPEPPKVEKRRKITINPKESVRITLPSVNEKKLPPQKPKICLSSTRTKLPVDKSKVTMFDLLSYNPPMSEEQKERKRKAEEELEVASSIGSPSKLSSSRSSIDSDHSSKSRVNQGPRVKIGAGGQIVVDEESLVLHKPREELTETVCESSDLQESQVTYASFRNRECSAKKVRWTNEETVKFYKALQIVGTDFSLISKVFFSGTRSRLDLRNKFKKEEKLNRNLVDKALSSTNFTLLKDFVNQKDEEEEEEEEEEVTETANPSQEGDPDFALQVRRPVPPPPATRGSGAVTRAASRAAAMAEASA